jgi:transcriptional regulator with XRE-family HTH domain
MRGGDYVLMARRRAGLTQRQLADRLGCRQATVARWERGDRQVSLEDVQAAAHACGLQLDARIGVEDRSWWPQVAMQLDLTPIERVRRLTPPGSSDIAGALEQLAAVDPRAIVVGEVAGALHGWPLVLRASAIELCGRPAEIAALLGSLGAGDTGRGHELPNGVPVAVIETPPGTSGPGDLARSAVPMPVAEHLVQVAGLVDLLRIADATAKPAARREALALQAVLNVERARRERGLPQQRTAGERIEAWLSDQTPVR